MIFLIPPSEGKNMGWKEAKEKLSFSFIKPIDIASKATEKDLKCIWKRYEEGIELNKNIEKSETLPAIERYSGVMYSGIAYENMSQEAKKYFEEHFCILSGMFGILKPQDLICNYKLPIETKGLYRFWWDTITQRLNERGVDIIIDLLPNSYKKMLNWKNLNAKVLQIEFLQNKEGKIKKMTHGVKKIKGEYIKNICENWFTDIPDFWDDKIKTIEIIS